MIPSLKLSNIFDFFKAFPDEQSAINVLEKIRWNGKVTSPFDKKSRVYKCSGNRYKCVNTNKYFNVRTGTIYENSKLDLKTWFLAIFLFLSQKRGISSYQLAKDLGVTQKTAWFLLHRIRHAMVSRSINIELEGIVEADETFVGGKNKNRHKDKKVKNSQGRSFKDKTPVLGLLQRGETSKVLCFVIPDTKARTIRPIVLDNVKKQSTLMTDEWSAYFGMNTFYNHSFVDHGRGQYYSEGGITTNGIENFWSHFKRSINGTYYKVSPKHLQSYADEMTYRFNLRGDRISKVFDLFLQTAVTKRLTYKKLVYGTQ